MTDDRLRELAKEHGLQVAGDWPMAFGRAVADEVGAREAVLVSMITLLCYRGNTTAIKERAASLLRLYGLVKHPCPETP